MITKIGIVSGQILELLYQNNGVLVFSQVHSNLKQSRDFILMSLGWLLHKGYIHILENPSTAACQDDDRNKAYTSEAGMSDLVIRNNMVRTYSKRIKNMPDHIAAVADKILTLLDGCGNLLSLQSIESNLNEHRDIVLMGLGWLIREGYALGIIGPQEIFIFRLPKKIANSKEESFSHM